MKLVKQALNQYKSIYAAAKAENATATQLHRLIDGEALVDDSGQVWIKSKTVLSGCITKRLNESLKECGE